MSGECHVCGEHALECKCHLKKENTMNTFGWKTEEKTTYPLPRTWLEWKGCLADLNIYDYFKVVDSSVYCGNENSNFLFECESPDEAKELLKTISHKISEKLHIS